MTNATKKMRAAWGDVVNAARRRQWVDIFAREVEGFTFVWPPSGQRWTCPEGVALRWEEGRALVAARDLKRGICKEATHAATASFEVSSPSNEAAKAAAGNMEEGVVTLLRGKEFLLIVAGKEARYIREKDVSIWACPGLISAVGDVGGEVRFLVPHKIFADGTCRLVKK